MSQTGVYLAGPIKQTSDGGVSWRQRVKSEYSNDRIAFLDPTDNINVPGDELDVVEREPTSASEVSVEEIVAEDKQMLRESDIVLVGYSDVKSVGTPMEVQWAYGRNYYIFMWNREPCGGFIRRNIKKLQRLLFGEQKLSVWYRYHCDYISDELDDVIEEIQEITA